MSRARRTRRRGRSGREAGSGIPPLVLWAVAGGAVVALVVSISAFVDGRPISGRTGGSRAREAWEAYGEGAFAADSAIHLLVSSGLVVVIGMAVMIAIGREQQLRRFAPAALVVIGAGAIATLALLIANTAGGAPFRNYQPSGPMDGVIYALVMIIPLVALAGVALGARELLKQRRARLAEAGR